jgi:LAS superfamily LD-carboxypeptidase LdcB
VTNYPVLPIIMPSDLEGQKNGKISAALLRDIKAPNGKLHSLAATAWNCLQLAAYFDGIELKHVGAYRPLSQQVALFKTRYEDKPNFRKPQVTRKYDGKVWWLKQGYAPVLHRARSNHGWGLAIDVASASGKRLDWLLGDGYTTSEALKYGFTWAVADPKNPNFEPWHLQYVTGDTWTQYVLEALKVFPALKA